MGWWRDDCAGSQEVTGPATPPRCSGVSRLGWAGEEKGRSLGPFRNTVHVCGVTVPLRERGRGGERRPGAGACGDHLHFPALPFKR